MLFQVLFGEMSAMEWPFCVALLLSQWSNEYNKTQKLPSCELVGVVAYRGASRVDAKSVRARDSHPKAPFDILSFLKIYA